MMTALLMFFPNKGKKAKRTGILRKLHPLERLLPRVMVPILHPWWRLCRKCLKHPKKQLSSAYYPVCIGFDRLFLVTIPQLGITIEGGTRVAMPKQRSRRTPVERPAVEVKRTARKSDAWVDEDSINPSSKILSPSTPEQESPAPIPTTSGSGENASTKERTEDETQFVAFARIFSGCIKVGDDILVLGPR